MDRFFYFGGGGTRAGRARAQPRTIRHVSGATFVVDVRTPIPLFFECGLCLCACACCHTAGGLAFSAFAIHSTYTYTSVETTNDGFAVRLYIPPPLGPPPPPRLYGSAIFERSPSQPMASFFLSVTIILALLTFTLTLHSSGTTS